MMTSRKSERANSGANEYFHGRFTQPLRITRGVIAIVALVAIFYAIVERAYSSNAIMSIITGCLLFVMALRLHLWPTEAWHLQGKFGGSSLLDFTAQFLLLIVAALIVFKASFTSWVDLIVTATLLTTGVIISRYIHRHHVRFDAWMDGTGA